VRKNMVGGSQKNFTKLSLQKLNGICLQLAK